MMIHEQFGNLTYFVASSPQNKNVFIGIPRNLLLQDRMCLHTLVGRDLHKTDRICTNIM